MIIAINGMKGGVGKTTVAMSIAAEWCNRGLRVLYVDADDQKSAHRWVDIAEESGFPAPTVIGKGAEMHRPKQVPTLAKDYDVTIIDCQPRNDKVHKASLILADLAILPCGPTYMDAWTLDETIDIVESAQILNEKLESRVLITRKSTGTVIGKTARQVLEENTNIPVMNTELGYRVAYAEAPGSGKGVSLYQPGGVAALEIRNLVDEIEDILGFKEEKPHVA